MLGNRHLKEQPQWWAFCRITVNSASRFSGSGTDRILHVWSSVTPLNTTQTRWKRSLRLEVAALTFSERNDHWKQRSSLQPSRPGPDHSKKPKTLVGSRQWATKLASRGRPAYTQLASPDTVGGATPLCFVGAFTSHSEAPVLC